MLFNSLEYVLFLPAVVLLYWLSPRQLKPIILLVASYWFYMSWMRVYGLLLFALTAVNFLSGMLIAASSRQSLRRLALISGITINLACLAIFKYTNFFLDSYNQMLAFFKQHLLVTALPADAVSSLPIILPLGISFFVFEFIHYLTDVFRGSKPIYSPVRFGLFAAFFPSQIAGPIKRYQDFDGQLDEPKRFDPMLFQSGLWLIAKGMFKKVALGDNLAPLVEAGFHAPHMMGTADAWVCALAFTWQAYFDFSGYTDIGRGSAMLMGFRIPENFNLPYLATSLREFWRRWHISLSTWLRDYLYIPLGGSQKQWSKTARNLFITMFLGGLWHGASWHFVLWGMFHGVGLAVNRGWDSILERSPKLKKLSNSRPGTLCALALTFFVIIMTMVIFRAASVTEALNVYHALFVLRASSLETAAFDLFAQSVLPVALSLYTLAFVSYKFIEKYQSPIRSTLERLPQRLRFWLAPPLVARLTVLFGLFALIVGLAPTRSIPFIYFQF